MLRPDHKYATSDGLTAVEAPNATLQLPPLRALGVLPIAYPVRQVGTISGSIDSAYCSTCRLGFRTAVAATSFRKDDTRSIFLQRLETRFDAARQSERPKASV